MVCYWIIGPIVAAYQERRRRRLEAKAERARKAAEAEQAAYMMGPEREGNNA